ncbi:hypothetical protein S40288_07502 [Stachybotrys chartarum IBT 40288]|nr:hypothetical protein S40288_07502 [Stachybotrys chartarum IBT 40288]
MSLSWGWMTSGAVAGTAILSVASESRSRTFLIGAFAFTWTCEYAAYFVWSVFVYPFLTSPLRHLPEPSNSHWMMGQAKAIMAENTGVPQRRWVREIPNEGLIRYRFLFNAERLLATSPKALAEILVTKSYSFVKPPETRRFLMRVIGNGLLVSEGDEHKAQRRHLMPAFAFRHVKDLYPVFWKKARESVNAITATFNGDEVLEMEVGSWSSRVGLDIIGVAGMGRDFGAVKDAESPLAQVYNRLLSPSPADRIFFLLRAILPGWFVNILAVRRNNRVNVDAENIRKVCIDLIQEKKSALARGENPGVDILSVAVGSGGFEDDQLVDQIMTFLAAGHETIASSISWAVYVLCKYPEIQKQLREEVRERLPPIDDDRDITSQDIDNMPYLNAFCSEVLRYWSPVQQTVRHAVEDTTILGQPVPKGTRIFISPWAINRNPELWGADADEFKPERWLRKSDDDKTAASGGASSNYAYLTFLHGPRSCIGQSFAKAEFACLVAAWVGRFEFALRDEEDLDEEKMVIKGTVTAKLFKGMNVKVRVVDGF